MSANEDQLVFESFLRKRKDRMKLKWATYWFRLQTSTLRFYSQKPGSSSQPKGEYYMWMIQSVREVQKSEGKRYAFEISLKNGKKKQLVVSPGLNNCLLPGMLKEAADSADLRQTWVDLLWKALQSPGPQRPDPPGIRQEGAELRQEGAEVNPSWRRSVQCSGFDGERMEPDSHRLRAASEPWKVLSLPPQTRYPGTPPTGASKSPSLGQSRLHALSAVACDGHLWRASLGPQEEEVAHSEEDDYDELPRGTPRRAIQDEGNIYEVPLSNERATVDTQPDYSETEENIYDVPSSLLRRLSGQNIGLESEGVWPSDSGCVLEDDDSGIRGGMAGWMTSSALGAADQTVTNITAGLLELRTNQGFPQS